MDSGGTLKTRLDRTESDPHEVRRKLFPGLFLRAFLSGPWAVCELPLALLGLLIFSWRVTSPSPWWDEAVTRHVVSLSWPRFFDLIQHVDLVHCAYYVLIRLMYEAGGTPLGSDALIDWIRVFSVLCAALTAGVLAGIGRQLASRSLGWLTGLAYLASPLVSRYAQEARAYALVTLIAAAATLVLVRAVQADPAARSRRLWAGYGVLLALSGLVNEVSLLVLMPHAVLVAVQSSRPVRLAWARASVLGLICISPFVAASALQREQVAWLSAPDVGQLRLFFNLQWESTWLPLTILVGAGLAHQVWRLRPSFGLARLVRPAPAWTTALLLGLAWALLPVITLWIISQRHPLFVPRYMVFTVPGSALALGAAMSVLRWPVALIPAVALAASGWHAQGVYRNAEMGHSQGLRAAAACVRDNSLPGDGVIFLPGSRRIVAYAYPEDFAGTQDVASLPADGADILYGRETTQVDEFDGAVLRHDRLWVVTGQARLGDEVSALDEDKLQLLSQHYTMSLVCNAQRFTTMLYVRSKSQTSSAEAVNSEHRLPT